MQDFITSSGSLGRAYLAILEHAFDCGVMANLTTYNPCDNVVPLAGDARTREPLEWEIEALGAIARAAWWRSSSKRRGSAATGSARSSRVHRRDMTAEGIRFVVKGGKTELLVWSPRLREIVAEAQALAEATTFPASPLFPHSRRKGYSYSGWHSAWVDMVRAPTASSAPAASSTRTRSSATSRSRSTTSTCTTCARRSTTTPKPWAARATSRSATPSASPTATTPAARSAASRSPEL
jgi:hypothetical protein